MYIEPTIYVFVSKTSSLLYLHLTFRKFNTYFVLFFECQMQATQSEILKCIRDFGVVTSASVYWHAFRNSYGERKESLAGVRVWGASSLSAWSRAGWGKRPWWSSGARWWLSGSRSLIVKCSGPKNSAGPSGSSRPPRHRPQPPPPHGCRVRAGGSGPRLSRSPSCTVKEKNTYILLYKVKFN